MLSWCSDGKVSPRPLPAALGASSHQLMGLALPVHTAHQGTALAQVLPSWISVSNPDCSPAGHSTTGGGLHPQP